MNAKQSSKNYERTEQTFHYTIWGAANAFSAVERAVGEARDLAYMVLADENASERAVHYANHWLDNHGRNKLREEGRNS